MLTPIKINLVKDILSVLILFQEHKKQLNYSSNEYNFKFECYSERRNPKFSTVITDKDDDWFLFAIHNILEGGIEKQGSVVYDFGYDNEIHTILYSPSLEYPEQIFDGTTKISYPVLKKFDDLDSELFQLQTIYDDIIILALMIEYYTHSDIMSENYIALNSTKILNLEEVVLGNILNTLYEQYWSYNDNLT